MVEEVRRLDSAELHEFALAYNWDDGFAVPQAIADHPDCELATALALFWRSEAIEWLNTAKQPEPWQTPWYQFSTMLIQRILRGHYQRGSLSFNPELTRVQSYKLVKAGVPALFLEAVAGS